MDKLTEEECEFLKGVLERQKKVSMSLSVFGDPRIQEAARRDVTLCTFILEKLFDDCPF